MADLSHYVREQFAHRETEILPTQLPIEGPLADLMTDREGTDNWKKRIHDSIVVVGIYDSWATFVKQNDGTYKDAYGCVWDSNDYIAMVKEPILLKIPFEQYTFPVLGDFSTPEKFASMEKTLENNKEKYPVGAIGAGPWEIAWRLFGMEDALITMFDEPETIMKIFNTYMELALQFVDDICRLPIEAIWVGDDWADQRGPIFGLERWQKMLKPLYRTFYDYIHSKGKLVITHVCGSLRPFIPDLIDIGQDVFDTLQPEAAGMDPYQLKKDFGKHVSFWGCLGNQSAATFYTPEKLRDEIKKLKEYMSVGGGHILSPCKGLNKTVPLENLEVIIDEFEHNRWN